MKAKSPAHFELIKRQNSMLIRNLLRREYPQSIAQLVEKSELSYPTVASLLKKLEKNDEVLLSEGMECCGGRPGSRYELNQMFQHGVLLYIDAKKMLLIAKVIDVYGKIVLEKEYTLNHDVTPKNMVEYLEPLIKEFPHVTTIAMGIPGVVHNNEIVALDKFKELEGTELSELLQNHFSTQVFMENDLNAMSFAEVTEENQCFAHIAYAEDCLGVGIVLEGEIIHGSHGFAGEMDYLCKNVSCKEDAFATCILSLFCVLDIPKVIISGKGCDDSTIECICERLAKLIPAVQIPKIVITKDLNQKYVEGLSKRILEFWEENV